MLVKDAEILRYRKSAILLRVYLFSFAAYFNTHFYHINASCRKTQPNLSSATG